MELDRLTELRDRWERLMGRAPDWAELHDYDLIRCGIAETAGKNLAMQKQMPNEHRLQYASSVMENWYDNPRPLPKRVS